MAMFLLVNVITASAVTTETEDSPGTEWEDKIDPNLYDAMRSKQGKYPVWLWFEDIPYSVFTSEVYRRTGLTEDGLSCISENIDDELAQKISGLESADDDSKAEIEQEFSSYLERTEESRKIEKERTDTYIRELRAVQKEMYEKGDADMNGKINSADKTKVTQYYNNSITLTDTQKFFADVDNDGDVDLTDASLIDNIINN